LATEECRLKIHGLSIVELMIGARQSAIRNPQSVNLQSSICSLQC
jgi:hypothetical protein